MTKLLLHNEETDAIESVLRPLDDVSARRRIFYRLMALNLFAIYYFVVLNFFPNALLKKLDFTEIEYSVQTLKELIIYRSGIILFLLFLYNFSFFTSFAFRSIAFLILLIVAAIFAIDVFYLYFYVTNEALVGVQFFAMMRLLAIYALLRNLQDAMRPPRRASPSQGWG